MEQYPIPQFIEQEGKIAFFISFRQFFYLVGAGVACFLLYYILPFFFFIILSVPIMAIAVVLAFATVNGTPIINTILGSIGFMFRDKNYVWTKTESPYPFNPIRTAHIHPIEDAPVLQIQTSQLKKIKIKLETKTK